MLKYENLVHKQIEVPEDAQVFFVGDIHGQFDILQHLLKEVHFDFERDYLISVGDLIDRGPDNLKCLSYFASGHPRRHAVLGNHDAFMGLAPISEDAYANWIYNGGRWVIDGGYGKDDLEAFSEMVRTRLPVFLTVRHGKRKYGVVHAGIPLQFEETWDSWKTPKWDAVVFDVFSKLQEIVSYLPPREAMKEYWHVVNPYIWDRDVIETPRYLLPMLPFVEGVDYTFHGHTPQEHVNKLANRVHIDTGAAFRGVMTLVSPDLTTGNLEIFTVDNFNPVDVLLY